MSDIFSNLPQTQRAIAELQEAVASADAKILNQKSDIEKRERKAKIELSHKTESLEELKATSEKILNNIEDIITKLKKVL